MPDGLLEKCGIGPNRARYIEKAVIEADEVFFKAYFK